MNSSILLVGLAAQFTIAAKIETLSILIKLAEDFMVAELSTVLKVEG
jgi:hypothetical protein